MKNIIEICSKKLNVTVNKIEYYEGGVSNENFLINNKYIYRRKKSFPQERPPESKCRRPDLPFLSSCRIGTTSAAGTSLYAAPRW